VFVVVGSAFSLLNTWRRDGVSQVQSAGSLQRHDDFYLDHISIRNITLISSSCRLVLSVVLVPFYGIAGAVGSTIVYRLIAFGYVNYLVRRAAARDEG